MNDIATTKEVATADASKTMSRGRLLRRSEAARILGVSVSTLRRREGEVLNPIVGADGVHLFDEAEVRSVMVTVRSRASLAALGPSAGDTAADVFTLLDEGVHSVEIVKRLRLIPDTVTALQEQWVRMRGGFVVSQPEAIELGTIARSCTPASATGAIAYLRARVVSLTRMKQGSARCRECGDQTAYICEACVVSTRGPFTTESARIERRASESGVEETRIVVDAYWDDVGDFGGDAAELSTDWFPSAAIDETPISEMVKRIENSRA